MNIESIEYHRHECECMRARFKKDGELVWMEESTEKKKWKKAAAAANFLVAERWEIFLRRIPLFNSDLKRIHDHRIE